MPEFVKVARTDEVAPGQAKLVEAGGKKSPCSMFQARFMPSTTIAPTSAARSARANLPGLK